MAVRHALRDVDEVIDATVSCDDKRAEVRFHPDVVQPGAMAEAIGAAGFSAIVLDDDPASS